MFKNLAGNAYAGCPRAGLGRVLSAGTALIALSILMAGLTGCQTPQDSATGSTSGTDAFSPDQAKALSALRQETGQGGTNATAQESYILREGDTLQITFPGAPNLNTVAAIRRDGKIALPLIGEMQVAGLAPAQLQKQLLDKYGPDLQVKEVTVQVSGAAFNVYVSGAVLRPGKITSERPLTLLEAIMEAGGFDNTKANIKAVRVIRDDNGRTDHFTVNLKPLLKGGDRTAQFKLKASDIIFVPERFYWF
jgi:polysaccharide biosynthesis/export protein